MTCIYCNAISTHPTVCLSCGEVLPVSAEPAMFAPWPSGDEVVLGGGALTLETIEKACDLAEPEEDPYLEPDPDEDPDLDPENPDDL